MQRRLAQQQQQPPPASRPQPYKPDLAQHASPHDDTMFWDYGAPSSEPPPQQQRASPQQVRRGPTWPARERRGRPKGRLGICCKGCGALGPVERARMRALRCGACEGRGTAFGWLPRSGSPRLVPRWRTTCSAGWLRILPDARRQLPAADASCAAVGQSHFSNALQLEAGRVGRELTPVALLARSRSRPRTDRQTARRARVGQPRQPPACPQGLARLRRPAARRPLRSSASRR
jgi:hypothetical protein